MFIMLKMLLMISSLLVLYIYHLVRFCKTREENETLLNERTVSAVKIWDVIHKLLCVILGEKRS